MPLYDYEDQVRTLMETAATGLDRRTDAQTANIIASAQVYATLAVATELRQLKRTVSLLQGSGDDS
jgi:hypothetical protein